MVGVPMSEIINLTGADGIMVDKIKASQVALKKAHLFGVDVEVGILIDASGSMRDEYLDGQVEKSILRCLAFAASVDSDGKAQAAYFSRGAEPAKSEINLHNYRVWYAQNKPSLHSRTDLAAGLELMMRIAGRELGCLKEINRCIQNADHPLTQPTSGFVDAVPSRFNNVYAPPASSPSIHGSSEYYDRYREQSYGSLSTSSMQVVSAQRPFLCIVITDGEPTDVQRAVQLLRASSYTPVFWSFLFVSNDQKGRQFLEYVDDLDGRLLDNTNMAFFSNMAKINDETFASAITKDYHAWLDGATRYRIIPAQRF